jgi:signal transduction histidine kinase
MTYKTKIVVVFGMVLVALSWVGLLSYQGVGQSDEDRGWLIHTHVVLEKLGDVISDLLHTEISLRDYIFTGDESYLEHYRDAVGHLNGHIGEVGKLTADNSVQRRALERLEPLVAVRLSELQERLDLRKREGSKSGLSMIGAGIEKQSMDRLSAQLLEMTREEQRLLVKRSAAADASSQKNKVIIVIVGVLGIVVLVAAGFVVCREIEQRVKAAREIRTLNENLERRVIERTGQLQTANVELQTQITERARMERALYEQNIELQNAAETKNRFLANMSHELRTPLNGIIGFAEFLVDGKPGTINPKQREYLEDILNSGRHLLQLIGDILDITKEGTGEMGLNPQKSSLRETIEEACAVAKLIAHKKGIYINVNVATGMGDVTLDQQKFKQVLNNLLSNAVKFTHHGGKVEIRAEPHGTDSVELVVRDTGIGIKKEDVGRLFKEFQQLESGPSRPYEGTGLGLALARKIVELQGGTIGVKSEVGKGSSFTVVLPLRRTLG